MALPGLISDYNQTMFHEPSRGKSSPPLLPAIRQGKRKSNTMKPISFDIITGLLYIQGPAPPGVRRHSGTSPVRRRVGACFILLEFLGNVPFKLPTAQVISNELFQMNNVMHHRTTAFLTRNVNVQRHSPLESAAGFNSARPVRPGVRGNTPGSFPPRNPRGRFPPPPVLRRRPPFDRTSP